MRNSYLHLTRSMKGCNLRCIMRADDFGPLANDQSARHDETVPPIAAKDLSVTIPNLTLVRQIAKQPVISDVAGETRKQWLNSRVARRIKKGDRIAVGCGSRGIANIATIVRSTLEALKELGAKPFVVAAMGSHGGANSEGQRELLASYHISEAELGVPVKTDMDSRQIGVNSWGEPVWW